MLKTSHKVPEAELRDSYEPTGFFIVVGQAATSRSYGCLNYRDTKSPLDWPLTRKLSQQIVSPITHFFTGWGLANSVSSLDKRERTLVTWASVVPDLDGLGIIADR